MHVLETLNVGLRWAWVEFRVRMPIPDIMQSILKYSSDLASLDYSIGNKSCQVSTVCWLRFSSVLDSNVVAIKASKKLAASPPGCRPSAAGSDQSRQEPRPLR